MNTQMNLQRIPVDKLKPAKYNPRKDLKPGDPAYLWRMHLGEELPGAGALPVPVAARTCFVWLASQR